MRVIYCRAWVKRALCSWLVLLALIALVLEPEHEPPPARTAFRHIPTAYISHRAQYPRSYTRSGCVSPPGYSQIQYSTSSWQRVTSDSALAVLVFAAYWDVREQHEPRVRLLVHSERELPVLPELRCLFWYYNVGDPVSVEASAPHVDADTRLHVVTCSLPSLPGSEATPAGLSLVTAEKACGMTRNILEIQGIPGSEGADGGGMTTPDPALEGARAAVCVVWWRRGDAAVRLAEWLQMLRYFQVSRVYFYMNHNAHENVLRVVDYYSYIAELDGMTLDVMPYTSPPPNGTQSRVRGQSTPAQGNDFEEYSEDKDEPLDNNDEEASPIYQDDLLPYNECIYRAMLEHIDWVAPLDLDEIIIPIRLRTWAQLASEESSKAQFHIDELPDVLSFQRWWFPEMLQTDLNKSSQPKHQHNQPTAPLHWSLSPAPLLVPPGRIFVFEWRGPTARADVVVTGKLLRVSSVVGVERRSVRCHQDCSVHAVDPEDARVHLYTWGCGGAGRGVCRALRSSAVREAGLWRWRRAQQEATNALRRLKLRPHARAYIDDL